MARHPAVRMISAAELRIDPSIRLAFALPVLSVVEDRLLLDWPRRRSIVVVETKGSIRRNEAEQRRTAGFPKRTGSRERSVVSTHGRIGGVDATLIRLIEARDVRGLLDRSDVEHDDVAGAVGALMSFDGSPCADAKRSLEVLPTDDGRRIEEFSVGHLEIRSLLAVDAGVLARAPIGKPMLQVLRSQLHEALDDEDNAISEFHLETIDTVSMIRLCALLAAHGRAESILELTDGLTSIDDSTSYLNVVRGSAAAALGREADASASFAEATRLPRTNQRIVVRSLLQRARHRVERQHLGRALSDLKRVRTLEPNVEGLDRTIRILTRRR